jgi:hypothetical protein
VRNVVGQIGKVRALSPEGIARIDAIEKAAK